MTRWTEAFAPNRVGVFTGDYGKLGKPFPVSFREAHLLVMTPERLDMCTRAWRSHWAWLTGVSLLVVDEIHLLGDRQRGARLEGALSRLRRLNPFVRILGLSATLGDRADLADWLGGVDYVSQWRPVPLEWKIVRFRKASEKPELLATEVGRITRAGGKSLVFVQSRRRAEQLSVLLEQVGLRTAHHHAGLDQKQRGRLETRFREGTLDVLVATPTLEVGVNLPVRQVVIYDLQAFDGREYRPLSVNSVWQRVGRAGRPGLDAKGEAVLLAPSWDRDAKHYLVGRFETTRSGLNETRHLSEQIVVEVASGLCRNRAQLKRAMTLTLAHHQGNLPRVGPVVDEMCRAQMLRERVRESHPTAGLQLEDTHLGRIANRHLLSPSTVLLLLRNLTPESKLTVFDVLLATACSEDCEPRLAVDFEELETLAEALSTMRSHLLGCARDTLAERCGASGKRLLSALKMAAVAYSWARFGDAEDVATHYGCYTFEVHRLRDSFLRLLPALNAVAHALDEPEETNPKTPAMARAMRPRAVVTTALQMLASGLDEDGATLTLVSGIGPIHGARLAAAGIANLEDLAQAEPEAIARLQGVSPTRAARWINEAGDRLPTLTSLLFEDTAPQIALTETPWPKEIDPYRLRRALDLKVEPRGSAAFLVTGGSDPHVVRLDTESLRCDCRDAAKRHTCKHQLAVRVSKGDTELCKLVEVLAQGRSGEQYGLFDLWYDAPVRGAA